MWAQPTSGPEAQPPHGDAAAQHREAQQHGEGHLRRYPAELGHAARREDELVEVELRPERRLEVPGLGQRKRHARQVGVPSRNEEFFTTGASPSVKPNKSLMARFAGHFLICIPFKTCSRGVSSQPGLGHGGCSGWRSGRTRAKRSRSAPACSPSKPVHAQREGNRPAMPAHGRAAQTKRRVQSTPRRCAAAPRRGVAPAVQGERPEEPPIQQAQLRHGAIRAAVTRTISTLQADVTVAGPWHEAVRAGSPGVGSPGSVFRGLWPHLSRMDEHDAQRQPTLQDRENR